ncbi:MAG: precorrin-2 C(20)-methyltransferase, partial [Planctomycetes bacterium]|nr:precorrin-2 C(20)-methyltransferase [Planctomycetota bacterium]
VIPDGGSMDESLLDHAAGFVFMKSAGNLSSLLELLDRRGLLADASVVQNCGMATERVFASAAGADIAPEYFTVVLLKKEETE